MKELSIDEKKVTISNKIMSINDLPWHKSVINYSNTAFFWNSFNTLHFTVVIELEMKMEINFTCNCDKWVSDGSIIYLLGFVNIITRFADLIFIFGV